VKNELTDILLENNFDIDFNDDMTLVNRGKTIAQDLRQRLFRDLFPAIQNEKITDEEIKEIIDTAIIDDDRIVYDTAKIEVKSIDNKLNFKVMFECVDYNGIETLTMEN